MEKFAFMVHPMNSFDTYRKFRFMRNLPGNLAEAIIRRLPPLKVSHIIGVKSKYNETEGWFIGCPLTAKQMLQLPEEYVLNKIIQTGKLAERLGAKILGLGAFTAVVGDAGLTVAKNLNIPVTTGNSYTVATAIEVTKKATEIMCKNIKDVELLIIGATGSIGGVCAQILARDCKFMTLAGRHTKKLEKIADKILMDTGLSVKITSNVKNAVRKADVIITVTSSLDAIIDANDLKPGAVICDVSRPRDVSREVARKRNDVLIIEGGVVEVPGDVNFNFDFGFPPKTAYACMAETMMLSLERRYENFTLGRDLSVKQVEEINHIAKKHGFKPAGFRSFEREVTQEHIEEIKKNAKNKVR